MKEEGVPRFEQCLDQLHAARPDRFHRLRQHTGPPPAVCAPLDVAEPPAVVAASQQLQTAVLAGAAVDSDEARGHVSGRAAAGRRVIVAPVAVVLAA